MVIPAGLCHEALQVQCLFARIKDGWTPSWLSVLHWDEKLMCTLDNQYITEEILPVLLSGEGHTKLLGGAAVPIQFQFC